MATTLLKSDWYNSLKLVSNYKLFCIFFAYVQYNSFKEVKILIKCELVYYNVQILDKLENVQMSDNTIE
jgi:hypothetical protein